MNVVGPVTVMTKVPLYAAWAAPLIVTGTPEAQLCAAAVVQVATVPTRVIELTQRPVPAATVTPVAPPQRIVFVAPRKVPAAAAGRTARHA